MRASSQLPRGAHSLGQTFARVQAVVQNDGEIVRAEAVDVSEQGVCLTLPHALTVGSPYRLKLEIRGKRKHSLTIASRVCFCLKRRNNFRVGFNCTLSEFMSAHQFSELFCSVLLSAQNTDAREAELVANRLRA